MKKFFSIVCLILIGFVITFFLWPKSVDLPNHGTIEEPNIKTIHGEDYTFSTDKPKLVTFFYTECPDVCPMTIMDLLNLKQVLDEEGVSEKLYNIILITLDPKVDTPEKIEDYKNQFSIPANNWVFLRGTVNQTLNITKQFNMTFKKDGDYISHSTNMYLLDEKNRIRAYHDMNTGKNSVNLNQIAANIITLLH
ncbi:SCO family protein [Lentibacillus sp. Marseille-P4043]|uniref:SCO family protein n=1 Tax=Lentibacillus sp. Marseille-P4043 TaxID=2040293 RepID=UPI00131A4C46|nr:SCO family protein [Lentibacillus sp. Marseille-P4043]